MKVMQDEKSITWSELAVAISDIIDRATEVRTSSYRGVINFADSDVYAATPYSWRCICESADCDE